MLCTQECVEHNLPKHLWSSLHLVRTNLTTGLHLSKAVDLIVFNPPYVPTDSSECQQQQQHRSGLPAAWAGGVDGREVIDRFMNETLVECLSDNGLAYLVVLEANNIDDIIKQASRLQLHCKVILSRRCGIEHLSILRFNRMV